MNYCCQRKNKYIYKHCLLIWGDNKLVLLFSVLLNLCEVEKNLKYSISNILSVNPGKAPPDHWEITEWKCKQKKNENYNWKIPKNIIPS